MSTEKPDIPTLRRAAKDLSKAAQNEFTFEPNDFQSRVKARFYRRLDELSHILDKDTALRDEKVITQLAGTDRLLKWMEDPAFASWFLDAEYVVDTIHSLQQGALGVVQQVLYSDEAHAGDKLKAARMLFELADQFPGRKSEVRFLDDRINDMNSLEVDKEIKRLQEALAHQDEDMETESEY